MSQPGEFEPLLPARKPDRIERGVNCVLMSVAVIAVFVLLVAGMLEADRLASVQEAPPTPEPTPVDVSSIDE